MSYRRERERKKLFFFIIFLGILIVTSTFTQSKITSTNINDHNIYEKLTDLESNDISLGNINSGLGTPWNITHWANRTDYNLQANFGNNSYDQVDMPLDNDWVGYSLESSIYDLYDSRNWNNGSFHFGDNNTYATGANDSLYIANSYQNWTFQENIVGSTNIMSGNYLDTGTTTPIDTLNQDCLELRMAGERYNDTGPDPYWYRYSYDTGDQCSWESTVHIPRGRVIDSWLKFQVNPIHIISFNSWEFRIYLNDIQVFSEGLFTLKQRGENAWHSFNIPQGIWINTSNVYSTPILNDSLVNIKIALEYTATSAGYGFEDGENRDYEQVLIDNIELITKAEAQPSDIQLKINNTVVEDINWGEGEAEINGSWQNVDGKMYANFSSDDIGALGAFSIDLQTNLNLFARKDTPESNFETNEASLGTSFSVENNSIVEWLCYGRVRVPTRYEETELKITFPNDVTITSVFDPQNPSINVLSQCDNSTQGVLIIPVKIISATPDGFWKFQGVSPNYCEDMTIQNNATGVWIQSNNFLSGNYINFSAKISNSPEISSYIQNTKAILQIRFPNGSLWSDKSQIGSINTNGDVIFNPFQIRYNPPNYEVGEYQAIITWNNSYSIFGLNETGIIYKTFNVIHESKLIPDELFYEDIIEDSSFNLKVSFMDYVTNNPIQSAVVYTFNYSHPTIKQYFSEISPGYYFLEFNVGGGNLGNNSLLIYANSSTYVNKLVNITVKVIRETEINVLSDFINDVPFEQNFTVQFNYTEKISGLGINAEILSTDWLGTYHFLEISQGIYNLTCSTVGYIAGQLYDLNLYVNSYEYEEQSITIKIFITELKSTLNLLVNNTPVLANEIYTVDVRESLNVTVFFKDINSNPLNGATINVTGGSFTYLLNEDLLLNQYSFILNATDLGQGIDNLNIFAQLVNYEPQSIPFIVEVVEKFTNVHIFFDGLNVTADPTRDITIGEELNITVKYMDINSQHVQGATIQLSGDFSGVLSENSYFNQYSYILNSSQLDIGVRIIILTASKSNFQLQTDNLRINNQRIRTNVSGDSIIEIQTGQTILIEIELTDEDFGGTIKDANVTYRWQFGEGELTDLDSDGIYNVDLTNKPAGTYILTITADKGDAYNFQRFQITIVITNPPDDFLIFFIFLITAILTVILLISYLVLYKTVLRYPKPVRKTRKYGRTLQKTKDPSVNITTRKDSFAASFKEEIANNSKYLRGKPTESVFTEDKLVKDKLLNEPKDLEKDGGV